MGRLHVIAAGFLCAVGVAAACSSSSDTGGGTGGSAGSAQGGSAGSAQGGTGGSAQGGGSGSAQGGSAGTAQGGSSGSAQGGSAGSVQCGDGGALGCPGALSCLQVCVGGLVKCGDTMTKQIRAQITTSNGVALLEALWGCGLNACPGPCAKDAGGSSDAGVPSEACKTCVFTEWSGSGATCATERAACAQDG
jgi:hypothetical protein